MKVTGVILVLVFLLAECFVNKAILCMGSWSNGGWLDVYWRGNYYSNNNFSISCNCEVNRWKNVKGPVDNWKNENVPFNVSHARWIFHPAWLIPGSRLWKILILVGEDPLGLYIGGVACIVTELWWLASPDMALITFGIETFMVNTFWSGLPN